MGLLGYELSSLAPSVALSLLHNRALTTRPDLLTAQQLAVLLTPYDIKVGSPLSSRTVVCFRVYCTLGTSDFVAQMSGIKT